MSETPQRPSRSSGVFWGSLLILLGGIFLLDSLGIWDAGDIFSTFWPVVLILIGLRLILNARQNPHSKKIESPTTATENKVTEDHPVQFSRVFGDLDLKFDSKDFKGGHISTVFGDLNIDLSQANMKSGESVLTLNGVFGDITVSVPKNQAVAIRANVMAGDVKIFDEKSEGLFVKKLYRSENYETAKNKLYVSASHVFGDVVFS